MTLPCFQKSLRLSHCRTAKAVVTIVVVMALMAASPGMESWAAAAETLRGDAAIGAVPDLTAPISAPSAIATPDLSVPANVVALPPTLIAAPAVPVGTDVQAQAAGARAATAAAATAKPAVQRAPLGSARAAALARVVEHARSQSVPGPIMAAEAQWQTQSERFDQAPASPTGTGSLAFGQPDPLRGLRKLFGLDPNLALTKPQVEALREAAAVYPDSPQRFKDGAAQLRDYFDFRGRKMDALARPGLAFPLGERRAGPDYVGEQVDAVARDFPHSDAAVDLLERLIGMERSDVVVKKALVAIGEIDAPTSRQALDRLGPRLGPEFKPYLDDALAKLNGSSTIAMPPTILRDPAPAADAPQPLLARAAQRISELTTDHSLSARLKAAAIREKSRAFEQAADSTAILARELETLLGGPSSDDEHRGGSSALGSFTPPTFEAWVWGAIVVASVTAAGALGAHMGLFLVGTATVIAAFALFGLFLGSATEYVYAAQALVDRRMTRKDSGRIRAAWPSAEDRALLRELTKRRFRDRYAAILRLESAIPDTDARARLMEEIVKAETTEKNLRAAIEILGRSAAPEAGAALKRLEPQLPAEFRDDASRALRSRKEAAALDLSPDHSAPSNLDIEEVLVRARAAIQSAESNADLASRLRAQALREKLNALESAKGNASAEALALRQLEALLAGPAAEAEGSNAYGRTDAPGLLRRLLHFKPSRNLSKQDLAALREEGRSLPEDPARFKAGQAQLGRYFDFIGRHHELHYSHRYNEESARKDRIDEIANGFPGSDAAVLMLEKLVAVERSDYVVKAALGAIGAIDAPQSGPALNRLAPHLGGEFAPYLAQARAKVHGSTALPAPAPVPVQGLTSVFAQVIAPEGLLARAERAAAQADDGTLAGRLRATALRERIRDLEGALDQARLATRQLEDLFGPSTREDAGNGSSAMGRSWLDRLWKRADTLFRSKKQRGSKSDSTPSAEDDDQPARPPTLEEILTSRGIPESEWPAMRAKVDRVQTIIQMVGSSVGRDTSVKWGPGDLWAYFPGTNEVTYPFEDLLTHSEDEIVGLTDHEGGHRDITVLDMKQPLVKKYFSDPMKHFLRNGLEDPRVNNWDMKRLPGSKQYLHSVYDRYLPEDLQAKPTTEEPDLTSQAGDGGTAFSPEALQYPHVEFLMAANYWWRYGKRPPKFVNKSAEAVFDKALPEIQRIFTNYPQFTDASAKERAYYSYDTLKRIDEKMLPLYEPLVAESQKKMARQMKRGRKGGKGRGQGQGEKGQKQGGGGMPQPPQQRPGQNQSDDNNQQSNDDKQSGSQDNKEDGKPAGRDKKKEAKPGAGDEKDEKLDEQSLKEALDKLKEHAEKAAKELGGQIKDSPTKKEVRDALKDKGLTPAGETP